MNVLGELQTVVFNGKDCRMVYQNRASRSFHNCCDVGRRMVGLVAGDWSIEAMRDRIWRGESFSILEKSIQLRGRQIIVNWSYAPIYNRRNRVVGFISEGFSRLSSPGDITASALADWLESSPLDGALSCESFPPPTSLESLADSRAQLARSLRQALTPSPL